MSIQPLFTQTHVRKALVTLCVTLAAASPMLAAAKKGQSNGPVVMGEVTQADPTSKTFTVKSSDGKEMRFTANPSTEIELEQERPMKSTKSGSFSDVKAGSSVKVKYTGSGDVKSARDIDVYVLSR